VIGADENVQALKDRAHQPIDVEYVQLSPLDTWPRRATCGSLRSEGDHVVTTPEGFRKHPTADVSARSNEPDPHTALSLLVDSSVGALALSLALDAASFINVSLSAGARHLG
jgi:hypothetical protein